MTVVDSLRPMKRIIDKYRNEMTKSRASQHVRRKMYFALDPSPGSARGNRAEANSIGFR